MNLALAEQKVTFQRFLNSPTMISKVAFTILVMFVFLIVLKFSIYFIPKVMNSDAHSPYLIRGTIDGNYPVQRSVPLLRSVNEADGVEFTWSIWLYINDTSIDKGGSSSSSSSSESTYYHIFHKGSNNDINADTTYPIACPGLYVNRTTNDLLVHVNSFSNKVNAITITNIPIYKWFNLILRVKNRTVDIYINGYIKKSMELDTLPKQNNGDVYICQNQFKGKISNLRYFDEALNIVQIQNIMNIGYNATQVNVIKDTTLTSTSISYLGYNWYI